jgi:predicted DNA-binding transcriptional regulator YafY
MRDELSAPVAYDALRHGYYYSEPNFSLPAMNISESDLFTICVVRTLLMQYRNTPLYEKLSSVVNKIAESLPDQTSINPSWMTDRILVFPEPVTKVRSAIWDTLAKAIRDNRRVSLIHEAPGSAATSEGERTVDPYYLVSYKGEWYLNTYCHLRKSLRTFGVSRISKAKLLDETFTMPAEMTPAKIFGDQFGIIWKPDFHTVRIQFTPMVAPYIRERQWHPAQTIKEYRGGGLILEFKTNHLNEVKDWVLSWGGGATILSPPVLVEKITKDLRTALDNYKA